MLSRSRSSTRKLLEQYPTLQNLINASTTFSKIKGNMGLEVDGEKLFIVMGDMLGEEEDLLIDSLAKGAKGQDELCTKLFAEVSPELRKDLLNKL